MESKLRMRADCFYIPNVYPGNPRRPGDDALFYCREAQIIGVVDGDQPFDSGEYARQLIRNAVVSVKNSQSVPINPKSILTAAFEKTRARGASTACIVSLDGNHLHVANIGDNRFPVIREGKVIFKSSVQHHASNRPYQLGAKSDSPKDAEEMEMDLQSDDIVVVGTNGLFDNIFLKKVEATVERWLNEKAVWGLLAYKLANTARRNSLGKNKLAAEKAGLKHYSGWKHDDIVVVVAKIE